MDIVRDSTGRGWQRLLNVKWTGVVLVLLALAIFVFQSDFKSQRIDRDSVLVRNVKFGTLNVTVSANGELISRQFELIAAQVDGVVTKRHVWAGVSVDQDQIMVDLVNPDLKELMSDSRSEFEGAKADYEAYEIELKNSVLDREDSVVREEFALQKELLALEAETQLKSSSAISEVEYRKRELSVEQLRKSVEIEQRRLALSKLNLTALLKARKLKIERLESAYVRLAQKVDGLFVKANSSGVVQEVHVEVGQQIRSGDVIARIVTPSDLIAELEVRAQQARGVEVGQRCEIVVLGNKTPIRGVVTRVSPAADNGIVKVDVTLSDALPSGLLLNMSIQGVIYTSSLDDALYVEKPVFAKPNGMMSLYKLDDNGVYAERVSVQLGKVSSSSIEILSGLEDGDSIVVSDTSLWNEEKRVLLN